MASETGTSTVQGNIVGGSVGASSGFKYGGPWGALIGGLIGATVGTVGGFLSGKKRSRAKKYARMAAAIQQQREAEAYKQNFLAQMRQARIERASMLASTVAAGAEEGSGSQGALSSYGSQVANIAEYMSVDRGRALQAAYYSSRAKKNTSVAQSIDSFVQTMHEVAAAGPAIYGSSSQQATIADKGNVRMQTYGQEVAYNTNYNPNTMLPPIKPDKL